MQMVVIMGNEKLTKSNLVNGENSIDDLPRKSTEKKSLILFICGIILTLVAVVLTTFVGVIVNSHLNASGEELFGTVLGLIITLSYFSIPAIIFSIASIVLNAISIKYAEKLKALKVIALIIPILLIIINIVFFVVV